jgi:DNA-binding ferritin-like protein
LKPKGVEMQSSLKEIKKEIDEFGEHLVKLEKKHISSMNKAMHEAETEAMERVEKKIKEMGEGVNKEYVEYMNKLKYLTDKLNEKEIKIKEMKVEEYVKDNFWKTLFKILFKRK